MQSAGCGKPRTLQNGTITITFNNASRKYILRVPDGYDPTHPYRLVLAYIDQLLQIRRANTPRLDTSLLCRLGTTVPEPPLVEPFKRAFHGINVPLSWHVVEADEATYNWQPYDALVDWAVKQGLEVTAGPLVDFSSPQLPAWLWLWERDTASLSSFLCKFVEATVRRYRNRIRRWQLSAGSNCANSATASADDS